MREKRAIDATIEALRPLGAHVEVVPGPHGSLVIVHAAGHHYRLRPWWAGQGFPEDVLRAIHDFRTTGSEPGDTLVVAARRMSRGGRSAAEEERAGWVDLEGNARIVAEPALAVTRDVAARTARSTPRPGWTLSAGAVAEYLLTRFAVERDRAVPRITEFGLDWSPAQIGKVLAYFDREAWTAKEGGRRGPTARRHLADPGGLLSAWAGWYEKQPRDARLYSTPERDLRALARWLATRLPPHSCCVTGWAALDVYAPFTTDVPLLDVYVDDDALTTAVAALEGLDLRPVEQGARVRLVRAERHVLTLATQGPLPLASPVRVYADLLSMGDRGADAAQHLRQARLGC